MKKDVYNSSLSDNTWLQKNEEYDIEDVPTIGRYAGNAADKVIFNLSVEDGAYIVKALPFLFNQQTRFYVSVNGGKEHVFAWDAKKESFTDLSGDHLSPALESAVGDKLQDYAERLE